MGTNFYTVKKSKVDANLQLEQVEGCTDILHIGKSSFGWCFALRVHPEIGIVDLGSWSPWLVDSSRVIVDENCNEIDFMDLYKTITDRKRILPENFLDVRSPTWYSRNFAEPGPNGLTRTILGGMCIGHGDGPFDIFVGDFS